MKFEKAMCRLEEIVSHLESGDLQLEESLKLYEEGMKLSKECQEKLANAEKKVYILKTGINPQQDESANKKKKNQQEIKDQLKQNFDLFENN